MKKSSCQLTMQFTVKEKLYPISFIYFWTTFEHQVLSGGRKHVSGTSMATNEQVH